MSTTSSSSTSSMTSSDDSQPSADEIHMYKVSVADTIRPLLRNIPRTPEPVVPSDPSVMRITYTPNFDDLMGAYRTMRANVGLYGSESKESSSACGASGGTQRSSSARWLLLLAFVLRQSTSNYTIWKDRRDVVLAPDSFVSAHVGCLPDFTVTPEHIGDEAAAAAAESEYAELMDVARRWLPDASTDYLVGGRYSVWRAVRWELAVTDPLAHLYHKQFQVWHHRKELLGAALATIPAKDATSTVSSRASFDAYLRAHHGLTFEEIDERRTIDHVLLSKDSKNYHVWLHRAWYFHAMPFLLEPPSWPAWNTYAATVHSLMGPRDTWAASFSVDCDWSNEKQDAAECAVPAGYVPWPESPFTDELRFTAAMIRSDPWNNSAWCHRFYLFQAHLVPSLLERLSGSTADQVDPMIFAICAQEVDFALQWAAQSPCNECPFVHARCIAQLHQVVKLRLALLNRTKTLSSQQRNWLLRSPLDSPVKAVTAAHATDTTSSADASVFLELSSALSWDTFFDTFALLRYVQDVTRQHLVPRAETMAMNLDALAAVRDTSEREAALSRLFAKGGNAQYVMDNLHQSTAAQYHALFYFLEQCWLLFFSQDARDTVEKQRPPSSYVYDGITASLADAASGDAMLAASTDPVAVFLGKEVQALSCAKELHAVDTIRAKYWRHETSLVLHRHY